MNRLLMAGFLFLLLPVCSNSASGSTIVVPYCRPNYSVAPLPNTQSGNFNTTGRVCFTVDHAGPLTFNCSNMQARLITVNGTVYVPSACDSSTGTSLTVFDTNAGKYYFDVSEGEPSYASIAFWPGSGSDGSHDDVGPIHVRVSSCQTGPDRQLRVPCQVEAGYALVGGGAYAEYAGAGALLTESRPLLDEFSGQWVASSKDHQAVDSHMLTTYAIGLRLDGVNTTTLRSLMSLDTSMAFPPVPGGAAHPVGDFGIQGSTLGGGAYTDTPGPGQLLTRTMADGDVWKVASKDHLVSSLGWVSAATLTLNTSGIIERFGALEVRQMQATPTTVSTGVGTSIGEVTPGWGLVSLGGEATTTSGPGRMLYRISADENVRTVTVQSKDHLQASAGQTTASWIEVRKAPGSHGLCNTGAALQEEWDPCVSQICSADPSCCQTGWDSICVDEVTSICGRSCADHTCSIPSFDPTYWNDFSTKGYEGIQWRNNCYNYALNKRTDTRADPGYTSGRYCRSRSGCDLGLIRQMAINDGLIPTTLEAGCTDNRTLVALAGSTGDYHWYRRDRNGRWSHKRGDDIARNRDSSNRLITNVETADRGPYTIFGGYFCACSDSEQGQGHEIIDGATTF